MKDSYLLADPRGRHSTFTWQGTPVSVNQSMQQIRDLLMDFGKPLYVLQLKNTVVLEASGSASPGEVQKAGTRCLGIVPPFSPEQLGDSAFCRDYGLKYAYCAGAMANGIHSADMVIALGKQRLLGSFGSGGLDIERVERAVESIKRVLPQGPYAINLLHNPANPDWEMACVKRIIEHRVPTVEASAYLNLSAAIVYYRVAGLAQRSDGAIERKQKIIAKISRPEVARQFMQPAPEKILARLLKSGLLDEAQCELARRVPVADDITVEADSGGHTDSGVLTCIFPEIVVLRDKIQKEHGYAQHIRVGIAGGIGTPEAVYGAFSLGAAYVVTGSVNQACIEAGTSESVRQMLCAATVADVMLTPSADMFELGAKVQVLKSKTMYGIRAQKLYNLYKQYDSLEALPDAECRALEQQFFKKPLQQVWEETKTFFLGKKLPQPIRAAERNAKKKMALVFQWYLGQSSNWAITGEPDRMADYQIWCGPAMGACNEWLAGTYLQERRSAVDLARHLLVGAAYLSRLHSLKNLGVHIAPELYRYRPRPLADGAGEKQPLSAAAVNHRSTTATFGESTHMDAPASANLNTTLKLNITESKEYYKKTWELLPGGAHYNFADPERALIVPFKKGRNSRVWDLDGNEHLDLFCKFGALFVGHHNERYNRALMDYMEKVTSVDTCDLEYDVCSLMHKHIPCAEMVRFCLSGTEAVQNALRLARAFTGKNRFIRFHGHYHGNADNIMGARKKKDLSFPVPERFRGDMLDTAGRALNILEDQSFMLPWNEIDILESTIERYGNEIAAVLMEPICINGGGILPKAGYLEKAKEICERHNILLIFDEIITGVRLGLGGAQKILGVTPHLATFGKALAGGSLPVSAMAGRKDIMNLYTQGKVIHAGTFNGYPLGLAAVKATFEIVEQDPGCYERMGDIMARISKIFVRASRAVGIPMVVQGMPTALVYHSQDVLVDKSEGYSDKVKFCDIIIREICKRYGIQFSPLSRLYSNLLIGEEDVKFFEERIYDAMKNARQIIDITFKEGEIA